MAVIVGPPANAIRCRPITAELRELLNGAADDTGVERVVIVSGGQTSNHAPHLKGVVCGWKGSRRHDNGRAADVELVRGGNTLTFTDTDGSQVAGFVTACAARGATGIGAGVHYMGRRRIHVGFGSQAVWGAEGLSVNAPAWLRIAAQEGWDNPVEESFSLARSDSTSGRAVVAAREGLWLRAGAGIRFRRLRLLEPGTQLTILGFDGEWARVDLQGDGRLDGHAYAAYLRAADDGEAGAADEGAEEAADEEAVAELHRAEGAAVVAGARARRGASPPRAPERRAEE